MTIKKKWMIAAISIIVVAAIVLLYHNYYNHSSSSLHRNTVEVKTMKVENGWGYKVFVNGKMVIYQPTVPALDTIMPFPDEASAKRVGKIVMNKIMKGEVFSVSEEDIQQSLSY